MFLCPSCILSRQFPHKVLLDICSWKEEGVEWSLSQQSATCLVDLNPFTQTRAEHQTALKTDNTYTMCISWRANRELIEQNLFFCNLAFFFSNSQNFSVWQRERLRAGSQWWEMRSNGERESVHPVIFCFRSRCRSIVVNCSATEL